MSEMCKKLFKNVGPGAIGAGATQINLLISTILASMLPTGAVSYLYYADRLNQLPLGIIGIAVATTLLPILSKHEANGDSAMIRHYMSRAVQFCLILGIPAAIGLGLVALPIIQTLFEHGAFSHEDAQKTAQALSAYAFGIPAFLMAKVFASRFFARQDTKTPVKIAIFSMVCNVLLALLLLGLLGHVGMALATSIATWINAGLLYKNLCKREEKIVDERLTKSIPRFTVSAFGMAATTLITLYFTADWFVNTPILTQIGGLCVIITLSTVVYAVLLEITGTISSRELLEYFKKPHTVVRDKE
jgi:putative peptidoglycan lipid II flippase